MSTTPGDEALHDAFDRFLEARFRGEPLDPSAAAADDGELGDDISRAADLAAWVVSPPRDAVPSNIEGYTILREVGHGSMGTVFLARHEQLQRDVALKVLPRCAALSTHGRRRFVQEARTMASLEDDRVVRVYDVVEDGDLLAYAMEWIDGPSLRDVLGTLRGRGLHSGSARIEDLVAALGADPAVIRDRSVPQFWLRIGVTIARALQRVHDAGLVHRDVKPANILLRRDGQPLLADFGLVLDAGSSMSSTGGFVGTPAYAPPEQLGAESSSTGGAFEDSGSDDARSSPETVDHRADVYALGATLYECFAGAPPFAGTHPARLLRQIETLGAPPLRRVARGASRDLEVVLEKAMSPAREDRYHSAAEFADDLESVLGLQPIRARRVNVLTRGLRALRYRHPSLVGGTVGAAVVLVCAGVWLEVEARAARSAAESARQLGAARSLLVRPEVRSATWRAMQVGRVDPAAFEAAQAMRREAVRHYDEALARVSDPRVRVERDAVRLAIDLPSLAQSAEDRADLLRAYPALAGVGSSSLSLILERIVAVPRGGAIARLTLTAVAPDELVWRFGLVACLAGDATGCEDFWQRLSESDSGEWPMLDLALARLFVDDGRYSLALPRLQRVVREFPERTDLALDLARVYLEVGDIAAARGVLAGVGPEVAGSFRCRLLTAWADAADDPARAIETLRGLVVERPEDGTARYRLARLEYSMGHRETAFGILQRLTVLAPDVARYRLTLARFAAASGNLEPFLAQARYVLQCDFGWAASRGVSRDLLDILQVGGLVDLYARGVERVGQRGSPDVVGLPDSAWAGPPYGSRQQVEAGLLEQR